MNQTAYLHGKNASIVLAQRDANIVVAYWGAPLGKEADATTLAQLALRHELPASPTCEVPLSMLPLFGQGFTGHAGIQISGAKDEWAICPQQTSLKQVSEHQIDIEYQDNARQLTVRQTLTLCSYSDVVKFSTAIENNTAQPCDLQWCAAATIPLADHFSEMLAFEGHWAVEWQPQHVQLNVGSYVRENRRGRTSHDSFPGVIVHDSGTNQTQGAALGIHLGWSGNHKIHVERMADGRGFAQMGEWFYPGEITIPAGGSYTSPDLFCSYAFEGFNQVSQQFHRYVRKIVIRDKVNESPRPVHYNTWEGIYFDHDPQTLKSLADKAAALGAERFVLDDGWFPGRDSDNAGLGDWYVDTNAYPNGLGEVVEYVNQQGLEFGLWFEPEMVNPDSELYRNHPDWVLQAPPNKDIGFRNQLVLDLTRKEVTDYLYERIDALLSEHNIGYIKWDMNRDLSMPGNQFGKPAVHEQTYALYQLLDKLRENHPNVEIESCSSGGGRADFGILSRTDRVWTSDCNDALTRLSIQKGFSYFFPAELMGSHAGPRDCHITHRHLDMNVRASVAMFGHMGMEMDLRELTDDEIKTLSGAIEIYKAHRELIHNGDLYRLDLRDPMHGFGIVADDKSKAMYNYTLLTESTTSMPGTFYFKGLEASKSYRLSVVWPLKDVEHWPKESVFNMPTCLPDIDGQTFAGELLVNAGIQMPRLTPLASVTFILDEV